MTVVCLIMKETVQEKGIVIFGLPLVSVRLWWNSLALGHLVVTAMVTLSIDVTGDDDPLVRRYASIRWKLLTCWFNSVSLAIYYPLCLYCDWREKSGDESSRLETLKTLRDIVMTAILMPVTSFSFLIFWVIFETNPHWIAPVQVFEYLPNWAQHSLHSVSMLTVVVDLLLTPRARPTDLRQRLAVMMVFVSVYSIMVYINFLNGELVYAFLETCGSLECLLVYLSGSALFSMFFYAQWPFIAYLWPQTNKIKK